MSNGRKEEATYSHGHHESVISDHSRRTAQNSVAFMLPYIKPHHRVLDIGCGPGTITVDIAALVPQGRVVGCDAVESVLEQARKLGQARSLSNLTFQAVDANDLPFEQGSFDVVYCHQVLQHVNDPVGVLKEMRRVCKPGGVVAAREADYKAFAWYPELPLLDAWHALYVDVARANGGEPNAARHMHAWANAAGFASSNVDFTWDSWLFTGDRAKAYGDSWSGRVVHSDFATTAKKHNLATEQEIQAISGAWKEWAAVDDRIIAIPNGQLLYHVQ